VGTESRRAKLIGYLPFASILLVAAIVRGWQLSANGFGRQYYAAGVRSMLDCPRCLLFNSFDPAGFVSLDKPPIAIWLQVLSAKLIGFSGIAMLLPQVVEGLLAVVIVYLLVQRTFGVLAGFLSAALLAITPAVVAVDRSNNMESCLIAVLLLAASAALRAAESGKTMPFLLSMVLLGIGFNVKMGAALALAPALVGVYMFIDSRNEIRHRLVASAAGGIVLVVVSLSWVMLYEAMPAGSRPYAGSTVGNSMLELALRHNGVDRFAARLGPDATPQAAASGLPSDTARSGGSQRQRPAMFDDSPTGVLRLFRPQEAAQAAWWLPMAIAGALLGWGSQCPTAMRRKRALIGLCTGWVATFWLAFSFAGGVVHFYYLAVLGPPLAILAGIGIGELYTRWKSAHQRAITLPALVCVTVFWQAYLVIGQVGADPQDWLIKLGTASALIALLMSATLLVRRGALERRPFALGTVLVASLIPLMVMPAICALSVVLMRPNVSAPIATLAAYERPPNAGRRSRGLGNAAAVDKLLSYLQEQRQNERYLVAVPSSMVAAPLIIATGLPVMAVGGFAGRDPILTTDKLQWMVETRQLRFMMIGNPRRSARMEASQHAINDWVRAHGRPVDPALWRSSQETPAPPDGRLRDGVPELFDLRSSAAPAALRGDG
jgi:4-amino-4-deoxy-L-arabinose transferase-like glycosyltransferase